MAASIHALHLLPVPISETPWEQANPKFLKNYNENVGCNRRTSDKLASHSAVLVLWKHNGAVFRALDCRSEGRWFNA